MIANAKKHSEFATFYGKEGNAFLEVRSFRNSRSGIKTTWIVVYNGDFLDIPTLETWISKPGNSGKMLNVLFDFYTG